MTDTCFREDDTVLGLEIFFQPSCMGHRPDFKFSCFLELTFTVRFTVFSILTYCVTICSLSKDVFKCWALQTEVKYWKNE